LPTEINRTSSAISQRDLLDVAPVGAEGEFGEDGDGEGGDVFHLLLDEGLQFVGRGGENVEEEFVVDLEGHAQHGGAERDLAGRQAIEKCLTMAVSLNGILAARKLTQAEAARLLGVNQRKVSALKGYKLEGFSVERLMHFATALQHDVVIEIRPRAANRGAGRVMVVGAA